MIPTQANYLQLLADFPTEDLLTPKSVLPEQRKPTNANAKSDLVRQFEEAAAAVDQANALVSETNSARDQAAADRDQARVDVEAAHADLEVARLRWRNRREKCAIRFEV